MLALLILIVLFVALSGTLSLLDAALLSVSAAEVGEVVAHNLWGAAALRRLFPRFTRAVIVVVILTNAVNILGPVLIGVRAAELFGSQVLGILTAVLTALTILFSEIIPKALGSRHAPAIARYASPFLLALTILLSPIVTLLELAVKPFRKGGPRPTGTEEQIRALVRIGAMQGYIEEDEMRMIRRTFVLNDKTAKDIMVRAGVFAQIPDAATIAEAADYAGQWPHHRYPVLDASGHAVGFVMSHDLLKSLVAGRGADSVTTILHEPLLISPSMRLDHTLAQLQEKRLHLAIVADGGKVLGVVTLKDVLEELVGEMRDERRI
ncbi:MAG: CNNM domain-containing protein [Candidatus Peribacteraceae bacterium]